MPFKKGQSGNPKGRPKGARDKLSSSFIEALAKDFGEHGQAVIAGLRVSDPAAYVRAIGQLVPKEVEANLDGELVIRWQK